MSASACWPAPPRPSSTPRRPYYPGGRRPRAARCLRRALQAAMVVPQTRGGGDHLARHRLGRDGLRYQRRLLGTAGGRRDAGVAPKARLSQPAPPSKTGGTHAGQPPQGHGRPPRGARRAVFAAGPGPGPGTWPTLPRPADPRDRPLRPGWRLRPRCPHPAAASAGDAGPGDRHREPHRRRRQCRDGGRGACHAGWRHALSRQCRHAGGQSQRLQPHAEGSPDRGFHRDIAGFRHAGWAGGAPFGAVRYRGRACGLCASQSGEGQLPAHPAPAA